MEKSEKTYLRSAAFREIIGTPPRWIVQYGTLLAVVGFFVVGLFSYYFTYPDIVKAPIKISTAKPPQSILPPSYGILQDVVPEHNLVEKGELLAVLYEDNAKFEDIVRLEETVVGLEDFEQEFVEFEQDRTLKLGSVEAAYLSFVELHRQYKLTRVSQFHDHQIDRLNEKVADLKLEIEERKEDIDELQLEIEKLEGPDKEHLQKLIELSGSSPEVVARQMDRSSEVKRLAREQDRNAQQIREKKREIDDINQEKLEIRQGWKNSNSSAGNDFREQIIELKKAIRTWKEDHLIYAPIAGKVYYGDLLKSQEFIAKEGTRILSIVPTNAEKNIIGKMFISTADAIKVQKDQLVNIRFEAYPIRTHGLLQGRIADKSAIANKDGKKMVTIMIEELTTTNQMQIPFEHDMQGVAHIITEERPLLFRFFDYFLRNQ